MLSPMSSAKVPPSCSFSLQTSSVGKDEEAEIENFKTFPFNMRMCLDPFSAANQGCYGLVQNMEVTGHVLSSAQVIQEEEEKSVGIYQHLYSDMYRM